MKKATTAKRTTTKRRKSARNGAATKKAAKTTAPSTTAVPTWLRRAMQGLVYWMGLRDAYFASYKLTEGAIVAEFCNLLAAALPGDLKVVPEYKVEKLTGVKQKGKGRREAVDIAIDDYRRGRPTLPSWCIEVKRWNLGDYEADLDKLAKARTSANGFRALVLVVAQGERPATFVTRRGLARRKGRLSTSKGNTEYVIRRVAKAVHTLRQDSTTGYWACLLEAV